MHTLITLFAVAAACVLARPPAQSSLPTGPPPRTVVPSETPSEKVPAIPAAIAVDDYIMPRILRAPLPRYDENVGIEPGFEELYREFGYVDNAMEENVDTSLDLSKLLRASDRLPLRLYLDNYQDLSEELNRNYQGPPKYQRMIVKLSDIPKEKDAIQPIAPTNQVNQTLQSDDKKGFALTPLDSGYYEKEIPKHSSGHRVVAKIVDAAIEPRQIRQNPNLSRTKTLVASNIDKLRIGLSEDAGTSTGTDKPEHIHVYDTGIVTPDPAESIYGIALVAAIGAALVMAIVGFAFGWYTLSKRAKAAADVDYPAYGVTGPTAELAGDRKLAHSAHMYHYQHQKQQILAMERNCVDQRNGSVSDPESEEENEEGDYTVYECPGFATTGEMEVKNPLFTDDKTPATPGKCEVVKPQLKE